MQSDLEPGAPPSAGLIPLSVPNLSEIEWRYVRDCLDTAWISSVGDYVTRFEEDVARAVDAQYAVAMSSGTAALHIALKLAGVRSGDEVVLPSLTFVAPANAVRYLNAFPVFVDVDPDCWQLSPDELACFLSADCEPADDGIRNRHTGRRIAAVVPVDLLGHPCDLDVIHEIARRFELSVVEDAAESLGAQYRGAPVGGISSLTALSFNGNKIVTTGGGGVLATADRELADRARYLSTQAKDDPFEYVHNEVGYNYRLTNVQAAIGCAQLERLSEFVERKREIARRYTEELGLIPGVTPAREAPWARSTFWLYTALVDPELFGRTSRELAESLRAEGIQARPLWQPLHRSPAHRESFACACPVADRLNRDAISLPCSTGLEEAAQDVVIRAIRRAAR